MQAWASSLAAGSGVSLKYVSTPPARVWNPEALSDPPGACAEGRRLEEHLQACLAALSLPGMYGTPAQCTIGLARGLTAPEVSLELTSVVGAE